MIKYTGDLRCDFEKATAEITKLKDRILGYQEQTASLRASVKSLKQSNDFHKKIIRNPSLKKMPLSRNCRTVLPMRRLSLTMMAAIPVPQHRRHR